MKIFLFRPDHGHLKQILLVFSYGFAEAVASAVCQTQIDCDKI